MSDIRTLVVMRGLPGSGKSTLARSIKLAHTSTPHTVCIRSTDEFWGPEYNYDPAKAHEAHQWNQDRAAQDMENGINYVIIDNTNIQYKAIKPYVKLAKKYGYKVLVVQANTDWALDPEVCVNKTIHNVPLEVIQNMRDKFEDLEVVRQKIDNYMALTND